MISALRIPIDANPLDFAFNELTKLDGGRVCAVVSTSRNLRLLADKGLKTAELFTAKDFTAYANLPSGIRIPKQLRPFYLRKAAMEASKKDKLALFKNEGGVFLENFGAFAQASVNIFSFYRELSSEMIDMGSLAAAGKYTDYEEQIKALERLWKNYIDLLAEDGLTDEWEDFKAPRFRKDFIDRYDDFIFLIGGYLTKYELKQLEQVGTFKNVKLIFNYAGSKYALHEQYEKYLDIELDNRPLKQFPQSSCRIAACSGMAAQLELITKEAFRIEKKGVPFHKMAVLIPDEYVKTYFLRLDPYNLFDITSNENIDSYPAYAAAKGIMELASQMQKSKPPRGDIKALLAICSYPAVKKVADTQKISEDISRLINKGRLYLSLKEIEEIPFFKDFAGEAIRAPLIMSPSKAASLFKKIFEKFASKSENFAAGEIISRLEALEIIYSKIKDEIEFEENLKIISDEISDIKIDTPKGKIPVMGILESRNLNFDVLFIPAMNEDIFPPSSKKDLFLNTEIRLDLGLPTFQDRENLIKNYLLQIMEKSQTSLITYDGGANARRRSRFAEEIAVKNSIQTEFFTPKNLSLLQDKQRFFPTNADITVEKNEKIMENLKAMAFSATAFNDYLTCPLRFYFKRADSALKESEPEEQISPKHIGSAFHKALETLYRKNILPSSEVFQKEFIDVYRKELSRYDAYNSNPVERFRAGQAEEGAPYIAEAEAARTALGYKTVNREKRLESEFMGYKIKGIIDRIDEKDGKYDIIDYKFKDVHSFPSKYIIETQKDMQMPFYALLLETSQKIIPESLYYFDLKKRFNFIPAFDMAYYGAFKEFAERKFAEIFSPDAPFSQTSKIADCRYCDYAPVCGRNG